MPSAVYAVIPRTLCFILHGDDVLLIRRSPHKRLFPGKINGIGGHVEAGEDVLASARREAEEESGLHVEDLWLAGVVHVDGGLGQAAQLGDGTLPGVIVFVYVGAAAQRAVRASDEGELVWAPLAEVDGLDWVDGDPRLLRLALEAWSTRRPFSLYLGG
jgi:8-oxo-dGTP diphosphatase